MAAPQDLVVVESRLWAILAPYRDRLEANPLYGVETIRRPGAKAHHYFAGVNVGKDRVTFFLKPIYTHPELLDSISPALRKRLQGKSCFTFARVDDGLCDELAQLTERSFQRYKSGEAAPRAIRTPATHDPEI